MAAGDAPLPDGSSVRDQAEVLRRRATALADADARAYGAVLEAEREEGGRERLEAALHAATEVPLEIVDVARQVAVLAAPLCTSASTNRRLRGEALTAVVLAEAAATSAAHLVRANVRRGGLGDDLVRSADDWCGQAHDAARRSGSRP